MRNKHIDMVTQGVHILNVLGVKDEDIMLCGSITFDCFGLYPENRDDAHDVDFVVRANEKMKNKITEAFTLYSRITQGIHERISDYPVCEIKVKGLMVNVWFIGEKDEFNTDIKMRLPDIFNIPGVPESQIWVAKMTDTLAKKKAYNRPKDLEDKLNIAKIIME